VTSIGPFAANHSGSGNSPAYTAQVDYFFNTASPIDPEDGVTSSINQAPVANDDTATVTTAGVVTINVLGNDNDSDGTLYEGMHQSSISYTISSDDSNYDGLNVLNVDADITDNDIPIRINAGGIAHTDDFGRFLVARYKLCRWNSLYFKS
jgi:hypothetical protein